nr:hypothetical protein [Mycobacterium sp. ENV421]
MRAAARKDMFDAFLKDRAAATDTPFHLDTGDDPRVHQHGRERLAAAGALADRLVTQNDATDAG